MKILVAVVLVAVVVLLCLLAYRSASRRINSGSSPFQGGVMGRGYRKYVEPQERAHRGGKGGTDDGADR